MKVIKNLIAVSQKFGENIFDRNKFNIFRGQNKWI